MSTHIVCFGWLKYEKTIFVTHSHGREPGARTEQPLRVGCSRRVHRIVRLAVKKVNLLLNILLLKIFFANYCHKKCSCVSAYQDLCELSVSRYSAGVMPNS